MTAAALALVLSAALAHALWNYILKRARGGVGFMTLVALVSAVLWAPIAFGVAAMENYTLQPIHLVPILASAAIHAAYFLLLDRGYRHGDLSVVYPLARATGPLLTVVVAAIFLGERPGPFAIAGAIAVAGGAYLLTGNPLALFSRNRPRGGGDRARRRRAGARIGLKFEPRRQGDAEEPLNPSKEDFSVPRCPCGSRFPG